MTTQRNIPAESHTDSEIRWVWIDLDDTLIDFAANAREALFKIYTSERLERFFTTPELWAETYERHNVDLWVRYSVGQISRDELREQRFTLPFTEAGVSPDTARELARRLDGIYLDRLAEGRHMIDGAFDLLKAVAERPDLRTGILSNGFAEVQFRKMDTTGITPYIDLTVLSDDIGINKPDPRIFKYAMERTGVTDPARHIMIGDNPATDIQGALNAGWTAIWFDSGRHSVDCPEGATRVVLLRDIDIRQI